MQFKLPDGGHDGLSMQPSLGMATPCRVAALLPCLAGPAGVHNLTMDSNTIVDRPVTVVACKGWGAVADSQVIINRWAIGSIVVDFIDLWWVSFKGLMSFADPANYNCRDLYCLGPFQEDLLFLYLINYNVINLS